MAKHGPGPENAQVLELVLGYVNFSSGASDPNFLSNLNQLWQAPVEDESGLPTWQRVGERLDRALAEYVGRSPAFDDSRQAEAVLRLVFGEVLPAYRRFHGDLLCHQADDDLFNAFFVGRVCEATLAEGPPWEEVDRIRSGAIGRLNDYVGYRPLAVLESRRIEPYPHERLRPVPLFIRGAGVACGRYAPVVERALALLEATDEDLLRVACFDPRLLDELAYDPRAYDFDHPANKRPNYHFGLWDPHHLDAQARYRRFVVQQVTLDALMYRFEDAKELPFDELLFEAAAVLAGTILMAAGVSGSGPDTYDSTTTLATLLPRIAAYRDLFYERLIIRTSPAHAERLQREMIDRRQPFGGARQHLNARLARCRAEQLAHVQLARVFARMGYSQTAAEHAQAVPAVSARMICQIECRLTAVHQALGSGQPERSSLLLAEIVDLVRRGIDCGALVDPWNALGFDAQFSLFPAVENSVHDHRIDELVELMEQIFGLYARVWSEAAARDLGALCQKVRREFREVAEWWRQFAMHEVSQIEAIDAADAFQAAEHVARALNLWHKEGAATGDIGFWAPHAEMFDSPQACALVVEALLDQGDFVASMGLLIHWLGAAEGMPLEAGECSWHRLAERWLLELRQTATGGASASGSGEPVSVGIATWRRMLKFLDYLEANAVAWWQVPNWQLGIAPSAPAAGHDRPSRPLSPEAEDEEDEEERNLFRAAYQDVVYRDSTDDGIDGSLDENRSHSDDDLVREADRVSARLAFLSTVSRLWRVAALSPIAERDVTNELLQDRLRAVHRWVDQTGENRRQLLALLDAVKNFRIPAPWGDHESMLEYDRRRVVKESLLERIIATCVETADTERLLRAVAAVPGNSQGPPRPAEAAPDEGRESREEERLAVDLLAAILRRDDQTVRRRLASWFSVLEQLPLLYVPLAKGGEPRAIVDARVRQRCLQDLLKCLPRLGLLVETCRLIETAREMERNHPVGPGAVTEFDEVFKIGWTALVECLVVSAKSWEPNSRGEDANPADNGASLVVCLKRLTEVMLVSWLAHSHTLRLSVLEKVGDRRAWGRLVDFVERYGGDLFTQRFLNLGNLRAILHQGVDGWLRKVDEHRGDEFRFRLLDELDKQIPRREAVERLTVVLEAVVENYGEYRDYNSTTTQSDRGEMLYSLLDFLRLRSNYDRICWNLRPIVVAHEILVRRGCKRAAQQWRRALRERIKAEADKYESRLATLQKKYAMLMPTIAERIGERFVRPLVIDRVRALVPAAIAEATRSGPKPTFRLLQYETEFLVRQPAGVGFDVPTWLAALEEEVQRMRLPAYQREAADELCAVVPPVRLSYEEIRRQIAAWAAR